jgi:hypothetical protein
MLSADVSWRDVDAREWANLWRFINDERYRPNRLYALLDNGEPVALVDERHGQVSLDRSVDWRQPDAAAAELQRRHEVDQVIAVEVSELEALWEDQQRSYRIDEDYDVYVLRLLETAERTRREAVCAPPELPAGRFRTIDYAKLLGLVANLESGESFVASVHNGAERWWSIAGVVEAGKIVTLTSSQGLFDPHDQLETLPWLEDTARLTSACEAHLGRVGLGVFVQLDVLAVLLEAVDLASALQHAERDGKARLRPWPPRVAAPEQA